MTPSRLNQGLILLCVFAVIGACLYGSTTLEASRVLRALVGGGDPADVIVVWQIRLPRAFAALIVGFTLGICGAALQGLLRNPLAEPGVLGVSASAALGATTAIYYNLVLVSPWILPLASIVGALGSTALLALAATRNAPVITLLLIGVGLSAFAGALMSLLLNLAPTPFSLADMINWSLGSVANRSFSDLILASPFLAVGIALLMLGRSGLVLLSLGEESALAAGLNVRGLRILIVAGTGLAVGAAVSLAGAIGFVGLIAPHLVRPLVGYDPGRTLLSSGLLAGLLLVLADMGIRALHTTVELNLGVVAALGGAPVFVWIILRRGRSLA